jgi:hypothetical protein
LFLVSNFFFFFFWLTNGFLFNYLNLLFQRWLILLINKVVFRSYSASSTVYKDNYFFLLKSTPGIYIYICNIITLSTPYISVFRKRVAISEVSKLMGTSDYSHHIIYFACYSCLSILILSYMYLCIYRQG